MIRNIAALGAGRPMIAAPMVQQAIVRRRRKPVFVIDASVPGDVDTRANDLDGAFLYDLDDLEAVASEGRVVRDSEAAAARTIVDEEVSRFLLNQAGRDADPLVTGLRRHFEAVRKQVLAVAGVLLLTPGFATDTVGLLLFVPAIRHAIMAWLWKRLRESEKFHVYAARTTRGYTDESVIEGEFEEIRRKDGDGPPRPVHPHRIGGDHS